MRLDRDFRYIMEHTSRDPRVVTLCRVPNVQALLTNLLEQLTLCQNSLNDFLAVRNLPLSLLIFIKIILFHYTHNWKILFMFYMII